MLKLKPFNILVYVSIIFSVSILFYIKYYVRQNTKALVEVESQIRKENENIHILKAELSYLKSPQNIRKFANKSLNLQDLKKEQLIVLESEKFS